MIAMVGAEEDGLFKSIITNPLNVGLLLICAYLLYKIFKPNDDQVISKSFFNVTVVLNS